MTNTESRFSWVPVLDLPCGSPLVEWPELGPLSRPPAPAVTPRPGAWVLLSCFHGDLLLPAGAEVRVS